MGFLDSRGASTVEPYRRSTEILACRTSFRCELGRDDGKRALRGLCEECESKGRRRVFEVLSPYLSAERDDLSYAMLATRLRVPERFVKKLIYRMRQRYRVLLRREVRQTVADPAEVDEELRHLCGSLAASSALRGVRLLLFSDPKRRMKPSRSWSRIVLRSPLQKRDCTRKRHM